jgi:hypothetical protein
MLFPLGIQTTTTVGGDLIHGSVTGMKNESDAWCWWLMPVILATQDAQIKRIAVRG